MAENTTLELLPEAKEALSKSDSERMDFIREERWIPYPRSERLLEKLETLLRMPKKTRMPSMLIVGESHNGKSSLIKQFIERHPPTDGLNDSPYPVFYLESVPPEPDEKRLYDEIFDRLLVPFRYSDPPSKKFAELRYYIDKLGMRMLIFDEIHNALSGSVLKQRVYMNALKNLNNLHIPVVLVGTLDALYATGTDKQISSRFKPYSLPHWDVDRDYVKFLTSLEVTLPLKKPSNLATRDIATYIYDRAESGCVGDFVDLVSEAAILAIESGSEQITVDELRDCEFIPSTKRSPL